MPVVIRLGAVSSVYGWTVVTVVGFLNSLDTAEHNILMHSYLILGDYT